jgi:hypothetical protein
MLTFKPLKIERLSNLLRRPIHRAMGPAKPLQDKTLDNGQQLAGPAARMCWVLRSYFDCVHNNQNCLG